MEILQIEQLKALETRIEKLEGSNMLKHKHLCPCCGHLCVIEVFNKSFGRYKGSHFTRCLRCCVVSEVTYTSQATEARIDKDTDIVWTTYISPKTPYLVDAKLTWFHNTEVKKAFACDIPIGKSPFFRRLFVHLWNILSHKLKEDLTLERIDLSREWLWREFRRYD